MITSISYVFYCFLDWVGDLEVEVIEVVVVTFAVVIVVGKSVCEIEL